MALNLSKYKNELTHKVNRFKTYFPLSRNALLTLFYFVAFVVNLHAILSLNLSFYTFPFCGLVNFNYQPINQTVCCDALYRETFSTVYFISS